MPTWSQDYGGPMRPDQIRDLVNFVMNWGCRYDPKVDVVSVNWLYRDPNKQYPLGVL